MTDQWFYRMFGEEFGPIPLSKLKELAESGTIHALDQVRSRTSTRWVAAETVQELGLSSSDCHPAIATRATSLSDIEISNPRLGSDDWYCLRTGLELGPLRFDELLRFVKDGQLCAEDQVKLGTSGKWRKVCSIGRLMAALPFEIAGKTIVSSTSKPVTRRAGAERQTERTAVPPTVATPTDVQTAESVRDTQPNIEATYRVAFEQATARVAASMMAQADAMHQAAENQAMSLLAWAMAPNVDRYWWGWAGGVEFGPVEIAQVLGLARSGQLRPSDLVRNGQYGQFVSSGNVPGLFNAVQMLAQAATARNLAKHQAQAALSKAELHPERPVELSNAVETSVVAKAMSTSDSVMKTRTAPQPKPNCAPPIEREQPAAVSHSQSPASTSTTPMEVEQTQSPTVMTGETVPARTTNLNRGFASTSGSGFASSSSSTMSGQGSNRPVATPVKSYSRKPAVSESTWFSDTVESLKEPKAIGSLCVLALIMLFFGWQYLPKSRAADINRYQVLKQLLDEIQTKRTSAPGELAAVEQKLATVGRQIAEELKRTASPHEPAKQFLLWAARDEAPRVLEAGLAKESQAEKNFAKKLQEAAIVLGLVKRPLPS
jgi:F0F1-type ATP synthase membrane subunit b/b'